MERVVVVGAGHNGLCCAAYLALAGLGVTVCERRGVVGGAAVTEELAPGFRVSSASYSLSLLRPDVHADLELARHGLVVLPKDPQVTVPREDGPPLHIWRDPARTRAEIEALHPPDADGYARWSASWDEATPQLRDLLDDPEPPDLAGVERRIGTELYARGVRGSAADLVEGFVEHPLLQGLLASQGIIGTWASVRDPGTAWVLAYHALGGEIVGADGTWAYVRGGMGAVSEALASAAREAGAEILTDAPVEGIEVEGGRVAGVRLAGGRVLRASVVCSNAHPITTASLAGIDAPDVPSPGCVTKVNLALAEVPQLAGTDPGPGPHHRGTIAVAPSIEHLEAAYRDAVDGRPSRDPFMEVFIQSAVDDSLAPDGKHVLSAFTQYAPPGTAGDDTNVMDALERTFPGLGNLVVASEVLGPVELEERFGLVGGNIFHGELLPEHSFGERPGYRTGLPGLYLCGSGAAPGGCVSGAPGRNAARTVLADLGAGPHTGPS